MDLVKCLLNVAHNVTKINLGKSSFFSVGFEFDIFTEYLISGIAPMDAVPGIEFIVHPRNVVLGVKYFSLINHLGFIKVNTTGILSNL